MTDGQRMVKALEGAQGKRLMYRQPVGGKSGLTRISHCAKKRTAFLSHKLLVNGNFGKNKEAVRWLQSVANDRSISSPWRRGR